MKKDPLAGWKAFLASSAASATTMRPVELEGYLTGLVVAPDLIPPSLWISGLWGEEEPVFDSTEQLQAALDSVMSHYNAIVRQIDSKGARWKPMFFVPGGVDVEQCSHWVRGFWTAMMFDPEAWLDLANDERTQILVEPFTVFIDPDGADDQPPPENIDDIRRENAEYIPRVLPALRKLAQIRAHEELDRTTSSHKLGRNEPCPCGSGKKYKRCCGLN